MKVWMIVILITGIIACFVQAQEMSPAGGNYLDFSDKTYYIAKDRPSLDVLLANGWTIEMWLYVRKLPPKPVRRRNVSVVFAKPYSYGIYLVSFLRTINRGVHVRNRKESAWYIYLDGTVGIQASNIGVNGERIDPKIYRGPMIREKQWQYLALQSLGGQIFEFFDGQHNNLGGVPIEDSDVPLSVGGIDPTLSERVNNRITWPGFEHMLSREINLLPFDGAIDEIRISNVARYPGGEAPKPPGRFENDEHTLALWHFDEPQGSAVYIDSSGHGNTLVASNFRPVSLAGKRPVTWAHIKKMR